MLKGVRVRIPLGKLATHHGLSVWCIEFGIAHLTFFYISRGVRRWYLVGLITQCESLGGSSPPPATNSVNGVIIFGSTPHMEGEVFML